MAAIPERSAAGSDGAGAGIPAVNGAPVAERAPAAAPGDLDPFDEREPVDDLDPDDAFGHPAIADPARDDAVWSDGDEDDVDV